MKKMCQFADSHQRALIDYKLQVVKLAAENVPEERERK